nr:MAG TPA: hypothetical protein [Caudoviricetes sp.]
MKIKKRKNKRAGFYPGPLSSLFESLILSNIKKIKNFKKNIDIYTCI